MEKQHLTYFKIENFKRFDSFEMSNLGQFNLIVGDNNVGKTSLLEALTLEEDRVALQFKLILSLLLRNDIFSVTWVQLFDKYVSQKEMWSNILTDIYKPTRVRYTDLAEKTTDVSIELVDNKNLTKRDIESIAEQIPTNKQPDQWLRYYKNNKYQGTFGRYGAEFQELLTSNGALAIDLLRMNVGYNNNHLAVYYSHINPFRERRILFERGLRYIIKDLDEVRTHKLLDQEVLGIVLSGNEKIYPITQFGDGLIRIMRILLGIISCNTGRIMVDEIESGIHFSRQKEYWKVIINLCHNYGVQLFATTHSLECQQAFIEALEDSEMQQYQKDARNISLIENKQEIVEAVTYDFEQFEYALNIGFNTRGGRA